MRRIPIFVGLRASDHTEECALVGWGNAGTPTQGQPGTVFVGLRALAHIWTHT